MKAPALILLTLALATAPAPAQNRPGPDVPQIPELRLPFDPREMLEDPPAPPPQAPSTPPSTPPSHLAPHVDFAIRRGVKYLYSLQREDGSFQYPGNYAKEPGLTALTLLALSSAGEPLSKPEIRRAYEWLTKQPIETTYSLSLRAAALAQLADADRNPQLRKDVTRLVAMQIDRGDHRGLYGYTMPKGEFSFGDLSNSQYGVLGVWYAAEAGVEVPRGYWQRVEDAWVAAQCRDGGYSYRPGIENPYGSMTAAGIATLTITHDFLHASTAGGPQGKAAAKTSKSAASAQQAIAWLDRYFRVDRNPGLDSPLADRRRGRFVGMGRFDNGSYIHYMLFGYERVGEATGLTRFGTAGGGVHKWYDDGARYLVETQAADGAWEEGTLGTEVDTPYAVLFLSRGRSPVVLQKLQFDPPPPPPGATRPAFATSRPTPTGTTLAGAWNNRTRDAASIVRWLRRQTERHVNWQITRLDYPASDLRESPILYLASAKPFEPPEEQWSALKRYLDEGGLLLVADESSDRKLTRSVETLLARLYPRYPAYDLPKTHPFFTGNFPAKDIDVPVRVVSNGVRELAVLLPEGDFPWRWQRTLGTVGGKSPDFSLVGNILVSVTGRANLRYRGTFHIDDPDPTLGPAPKAWTVARIQYAGNWDPEPAGWSALAVKLHNAREAELTRLDLSLADGSLAAGRYPLAHLTGTHPPALSDREKRTLADYLRAGGTLLIDAAGGDEDMGLWIEPAMSDLLPDLKWKDLPPDHPVYDNLLSQTGTVPYRPAAADRVGARNAPPRLRAAYLNDRLAILSSPEDLSAGLTGVPHDHIIGYTPDTARALATNLLRWLNR